MIPNKGRGRFIHFKIVEQQDSHDVVFRDEARVDQIAEIRRILRDAGVKNLDEPTEEEQNRKFLFKD